MRYCRPLGRISVPGFLALAARKAELAATLSASSAAKTEEDTANSSATKAKNGRILSLDEGQQVGIDGVSFSGRHAMRKTFIGFQDPVLQQFRRQWPGVGIRHDLVVVAMHHLDGHVDLLEVLGEIGLG